MTSRRLTWYVDPLGIADRIAQQNAGARIGMAILPAIGLDGLQAVGGSLTFSAGEFDMVNHMHVLLAIPRAGVLAAVALDSGELTPEKWVSGDVAGYMSFYWDFQKTYNEVEKLYDSFRGEGATAEWAKILVADQIGVDPIVEILPQLTGRVTWISQVMKPVRANSTANLVAIELEDPIAFQKTLEKMVERLPQLNNDLAPEKKTIGSSVYYRISVPTPPNYQEGDPLPEPAFGISHGCFMLSDREIFLKNIITGQNSTESVLADQLDFKLIASKATRAVGGAKPGLLAFNRPEEGLRYLYELANAEQTRKRLSGRRRTQPVLSLAGRRARAQSVAAVRDAREVRRAVGRCDDQRRNRRALRFVCIEAQVTDEKTCGSAWWGRHSCLRCIRADRNVCRHGLHSQQKNHRAALAFRRHSTILLEHRSPRTTRADLEGLAQQQLCQRKSRSTRTSRILLVDDDQEIVESMRIALQAKGYEILVARDGNQGLAMAEREAPDLVILDMMMPKRSGFLVIEKLRRSSNDAAVKQKIIMITANEGSRHKAYAEMLGVDDYIRKPFAMDRLMESVERLIGVAETWSRCANSKPSIPAAATGGMTPNGATILIIGTFPPAAIWGTR